MSDGLHSLDDRPLTVAIDGPAASGKGTLAKRLAVLLGVPHLDTGLLYRAVGRRVLDDGADPADAEAATAAAVALVPADLGRSDLRGPVADAAAAKVASVPGVRAALLEFQRRFAQSGAVLDGRDIGTVVLPDAQVKLFVTAGLDVRARRRHQELMARGGNVPDFEMIRAEMAARDEADRTRAAAPLRPADDAAILDTSSLDASEALARAEAIIRWKLGV
ncbi:(d)CMP kinase [Acidisoma cellulosilytica]|uniref:Cytidylate kinase n=1 Tax=Acidisoma cellulosilyticum TaxID=2802395 RepID=A0A963YY36_9PROT|nr:(d)CMP kinase [Acidisoma cellulosilyticum]MCB8878904.1 (d)CMP kinase [Acidisoma cellulosilyticum]